MLPFDDQSFDLVFTVTVLQHNHDNTLIPLIGEICRVGRGPVWAFEDTGPRRRERHSFILRPIAEYDAHFGQHGYVLAESEPLGIAASAFAGRALTAVGSRGRGEGAPIGSIHDALETGALGVTRRLDHVIPQRRGLTRMVFRRSGNPNRSDQRL